MANYAQKKGINPDYIMPKMDETEMFAYEAADVAMEAIKNGVARIKMDHAAVVKKTLDDIKVTRDTIEMMMVNNLIHRPDVKILEEALKKAVDAVKK
jgi:malate dehydrogenase (oxaloacetate-decarboxylating)